MHCKIFLHTRLWNARYSFKLQCRLCNTRYSMEPDFAMQDIPSNLFMQCKILHEAILYDVLCNSLYTKPDYARYFIKPKIWLKIIQTVRWSMLPNYMKGNIFHETMKIIQCQISKTTRLCKAGMSLWFGGVLYLFHAMVFCVAFSIFPPGRKSPQGE